MIKDKILKAALALSLVFGASSVFAKKFTLDLIETQNNQFTFPDVGAVDQGGFPGGTKILIEANIYPEGTIEQYCGNDPTQKCVVPAAVKPLGRWYCWATIMNSNPFDPLRPLVLGGQMYEFTENFEGFNLKKRDGNGSDTLISMGYENGFGDSRPAYRAITGGTGKFRGTTGEMAVSLIGIYDVNNPAVPQPVLRSEINVKKIEVKD